MKNIDLPRLGIIGTVGVPAKYGGFETLVHHLVLNLNKEFDITVYNSKKAYKIEERVKEWNGAKMVYMPFRANGFQSIFYDLFSMFHALKRTDFILVLGVSAGLFFPLIKLFSKKRIVINIDGLEWRRPKWNWFAKTFLLLSEMVACRFADEIITDNRILKEYVKIRYNRISSLIEYGADHTNRQEVGVQDRLNYTFLNKKYAFKVSRIEPENNIEMILQAFSEYVDLDLVLVGNWGDSNYGKKIKKAYQQFENLHLLDPIYEIRALDVLRSNAYIYVHGHSAGGTNPSLVEAMYLQIPILSFDAIFNRVTTNNQAIYFSDIKGLQYILKNLDNYPLLAVAKKLKEIADQQYTWSIISSRYAKVIDENYSPPIKIPEQVPIAHLEQVRVHAI